VEKNVYIKAKNKISRDEITTKLKPGHLQRISIKMALKSSRAGRGWSEW
jgi:hypothetical protein